MAEEKEEGKEGGAHGGGGDAESLRRYALPGPQAEPTAGLWIDGRRRILVPTIAEVTELTEPLPRGSGDERFEISKGDFPSSEAELDQQLQLLTALEAARPNSPYPENQPFGPSIGNNGRFRPTPLSQFLHLQPVPFGAVFDLQREQVPLENVTEQHLRILKPAPVVDEGQELARMFENETPGLYHRHALNWALFNRLDISPPRQARIWMALDMAIYTALNAAWYYKWLHPRYSRLLRPEEFDGEGGRLTVLYDRPVTSQGHEFPLQPVKDCPSPTPGTPRHPAWPSGHSTYSAAASYILEFFLSPETLGFPAQPGDKPPAPVSDDKLFKRYKPGNGRITESGWVAAELRRLANNIGEARLWGGVHWLSDHIAGQKIGRAAGEAVARQFRGDCVPPVERRPCKVLADQLPPSTPEIEAMAGRGTKCQPGQDKIPPTPPGGSRGADFLARFGTN